MGLHTVRLELDAWLRNDTLEEETNIGARAQALDFIRYVEQIVHTYHGASGAVLSAELASLQKDAAAFKERLAAINEGLFCRVRTQIRAGSTPPAAWRRRLGLYTDYAPTDTPSTHIGYDGLDALINGVLRLDPHPQPSTTPAADMVHCEPTPARAILDLTDRIDFTGQDIFYDIGSGLGQVVILVHLLTGVRARGIEFDPGYYTQAQRTADALNLTDVAFINTDARGADYGDGTIFFMFTPFTGGMLQTVLERLRDAAQLRPITLCTYGSCTLRVAEQPWLRIHDPASLHPYKLALFKSNNHGP